MADPTDDRWWGALAHGGERAFAAVYDQFAAGLLRVAWAMLGSREEAEDCVQDVFVGLVRSRQAVAATANFRAYLFTCLRHRVARQAQRRCRLPMRSLDDVPEAALAAAPLSDGARSVALELALARLPSEQREVVVLKIDGGLTFAEIAAVVGVAPNTAASRYRYALEKLRAALQEEPHV